ncbi:MAG: hypothetical protein NVS2B3_19220 [Vulcanimicrobiaceae bacterium]
MNRTLASVLSVALLGSLVGTVGGGAASAKPCHDARGKFVRCSSTMAQPTKKRCRDAKGRFAKCPDAMAMPAKKM